MATAKPLGKFVISLMFMLAKSHTLFISTAHLGIRWQFGGLGLFCLCDQRIL